MLYRIVPYEGVNDIKFGMNTEEIQKRVGSEPRKFKKYFTDLFETDEYDDFFVYYNASGVSEAIEFHSEAELFFEHINLFKCSYKDVEIQFGSIDEKLCIEECGFTSYKYGIGVYVSSKEGDDVQIESVIVFKKGYYDLI